MSRLPRQIPTHRRHQAINRQEWQDIHPHEGHRNMQLHRANGRRSQQRNDRRNEQGAAGSGL